MYKKCPISVQRLFFYRPKSVQTVIQTAESESTILRHKPLRQSTILSITHGDRQPKIRISSSLDILPEGVWTHSAHIKHTSRTLPGHFLDTPKHHISLTPNNL